MFTVVEQKLGAEDSHRRGEQRCRAIGMAARATSGEHTCPALNALEVARGCNKAGYATRGSRDCAQSERAGTALTRALVGEIREDSSRLDDTAPSRRQHRDDSAPE